MRAALHRPLAVALCGALLALLALPAFAKSEPPAQTGKSHVRVALLPIAVHAAGDESDYLSSGLQEMLAARLEQFDGVEVVQPDVAGVRDADAAVAAGHKASADMVLYGAFTRFGDGASLDVHCVSVTAPAAKDGNRRVFVHSGTLAEIIPQLDTLAEKVARYALAPARPVREGEPPAPSTGPSNEAFRELQKRVEALEREVHRPVAPVAAEAKPAKPEPEARPIGPMGAPVR